MKKSPAETAGFFSELLLSAGVLRLAPIERVKICALTLSFAAALSATGPSPRRQPR